MFDYQAPVDNLIHHAMDAGEPDELVPFTVTGVVCTSASLASRVLEEAGRTNRRIPKYLSVVCLNDAEEGDNRLPGVTQVVLPYGELGECVCRRLVASIEQPGEEEDSFKVAYHLTEGESVDVPITLRSKKILVVGTLNMDTLISIGSFPRTGQTSKATRRATMPGGKGINQATAAARLGAEVYLIGKVGKDYDGSKLFNFLKQNNVNTDGLLSTAKADTGHAYIYVQEDGESSIVIYEGANGCLTCEEIERQARLFENASFCLLQTEMKMDLVTFTAELAQRHGCKVMLKPSVLSHLDERLLRSVDILLPNEREINTLCPFLDSFEEKAQYFLDRGVGDGHHHAGQQGRLLPDESAWRLLCRRRLHPGGHHGRRGCVLRDAGGVPLPELRPRRQHPACNRSRRVLHHLLRRGAPVPGGQGDAGLHGGRAGAGRITHRRDLHVRGTGEKGMERVRRSGRSPAGLSGRRRNDPAA